MQRDDARDRLTNIGLGVLLLVVSCSGLAANTFGTPLVGTWVVVLHGTAGIGLVVLSGRKSRIVRRSLARFRRRPGTPLSLALAVLVVVTVATGLVHATGLTDRVGPLTLMQVHIGAAVLAAPLAVQHYRRRPRRGRTPARLVPEAPRPDPRRRALLTGAVVTVAAGASWAGWETALSLGGAPGAGRRFTGSHERGSGDPRALPVTQWLDDRVRAVNPGSWHLEVTGRRLTPADLRDLPQDDVVAVLDCTSLWWSEQVWRGVRLDRLLDVGDANSIEVRSAPATPGSFRRGTSRACGSPWSAAVGRCPTATATRRGSSLPGAAASGGSSGSSRSNPRPHRGGSSPPTP